MLITHEEREILLDFIDYKRPKWCKSSLYGWKPTLWKPRLKWLNEQIELINK